MKTQTEEQLKIKALNKFITDEDGSEDFDYCEKLMRDGDYLILTDKEADEKAKEYILDSVWAFNYNFLCAHSEAIAEIPEKDFTAMQGKLCESFNKAVLAMIPDKEHFVEDAIASDGRGHFLSQYDGEENEQDGFYLYRVN